MFILLEKRHHFVRESGLTEVAEALIRSRGPAVRQLRVANAEAHAFWLAREGFAGLAQRVVRILIAVWARGIIFQSGQNLSTWCR